jgi:hypothetical protein
MTSEPMARVRFLAAVAILGGALTLTACSSDSSDSSDGPGDSAAVTGECNWATPSTSRPPRTVYPPVPPNPGVKTHAYPCHPDPEARRRAPGTRSRTPTAR